MSRSCQFFPLFKKVVEESTKETVKGVGQAVDEWLTNLQSKLNAQFAVTRHIEFLEQLTEAEEDRLIEAMQQHCIEDAGALLDDLVLATNPVTVIRDVCAELIGEIVQLSPQRIDRLFPLPRSRQLHNPDCGQDGHECGRVFGWDPELACTLPDQARHYSMLLRIRTQLIESTRQEFSQLILEVHRCIVLELQETVTSVLNALNSLRSNDELLNTLASWQQNQSPPVWYQSAYKLACA